MAVVDFDVADWLTERTAPPPECVAVLPDRDTSCLEETSHADVRRAAK
jgi:hypothetical protein